MIAEKGHKMEFEVINAGNCMLCGKPIKLNDGDFPDVFFCKRCNTQMSKEHQRPLKENRA